MEQGDIIKFGRVRFRVKKLVTLATGTGLNEHHAFDIDSAREVRLSEANDTALYSRRSTEGGADQMVRL